jgi:hypothetical protein
MSDTYYETPTEFMKRIADYHRQVFESEKKEIPGGDILPNSASWDIVRKSAIKAMNDIFSPFVEPMNQMNLVYSNPEGTSFRIAPIPGSFAYRRGVEKIIVSIDLRKNTNILSRVTSKDYIIEVSIMTIMRTISSAICLIILVTTISRFSIILTLKITLTML